MYRLGLGLFPFHIFSIEPGDVLPGGGPSPTPGDPEPRPAGRMRGVVCEFCECTLAADGSVIKRGECAGKYLDQDRTIAKLREDLAEAKAESGRQAEEVSRLKSEIEKSKRLW